MARRSWNRSVAGLAARTGDNGYLLGLALGFLPCGFLYAALATSAASGSPLWGALAMLAFGAGTAPALVALGVVGQVAGRRWQRGVTRGSRGDAAQRGAACGTRAARPGGWWVSTKEDSMLKDWPAMATELTGDIRSLRAGAPEVMKGFSALAQAALKADALDTKTKELIALAIAVATRCDGCIAFHAEAAIKQAPRARGAEDGNGGIHGCRKTNVSGQALEAFDQFSAKAAAHAA